MLPHKQWLNYRPAWVTDVTHLLRAPAVIAPSPRSRLLGRRMLQVAIITAAIVVLWGVLATLSGTLAVLFRTAPSDRLIDTTVFVLAWGLIPAVTMGICLGISTALVIRCPERSDARALAACLISVGVVLENTYMPTFYYDVRGLAGVLPFIPFGAFDDLLDILTVAALPTAAVALMRFASSPDPTLPEMASPRRPRIARLHRRLFGWPGTLIIVGTLTPGLWYEWWYGWTLLLLAAMGARVSSYFAEGGRGEHTAISLMALSAPLALLLVSTLGSLILRMADYAPRASFFYFDVDTLAVTSGACAMALILSHGILFRGVMGPRLVLRRAFVAGVATAASLFVFAGLESLLADLVVTALQLPGQVATFLAGGCFAVTAYYVRTLRKAKRSGQTADGHEMIGV